MKKLTKDYGLQIGIIIMSLFLLTSAFLTIYFGLITIKKYYEIAKNFSLDFFDVIIILCFSMILILMVFRVVYLVYQKINSWK